MGPAILLGVIFKILTEFVGGGKHFHIRKRYLGSHFQLITVQSSNKHELKLNITSVNYSED